MILSNIPTLGNINCGAELRVIALKLQNYAQVNARASGKFGETLAKFWEDQAQLLKKDNGHPSDGLFLGFGVIDPRAQCYKVLSAIRKSRTIAPQHGLAWEKFCDFLADAARKAGGAPAEVTLKLSKTSLNMAKPGNPAAAKAESEQGFKGNFVQTITVTVTPAGTPVTFDDSRMMGGSLKLTGNTLTVTSGTDDGEFIVMAGGKQVTGRVTVFDRGMTTESIPAITVGTPANLPSPFYTLYTAGEHTATLYSTDPAKVTVSKEGVLTGVAAGFARVGAAIVYKDCPELVWADSSGVDINAKAKVVRAKAAPAAE